jgi:hypothetical protein
MVSLLRKGKEISCSLAEYYFPEVIYKNKYRDMKWGN